MGDTASAAFHASQPEILVQLENPQPQPTSEIVILGSQHENNLGESGVAIYDEPQTVRLRVLLEDYTNTYDQIEGRLAAYELGDDDRPDQYLDYLPKDVPCRMGDYLATLERPGGKKAH